MQNRIRKEREKPPNDELPLEVAVTVEDGEVKVIMDRAVDHFTLNDQNAAELAGAIESNAKRAMGIKAARNRVN